MNQTGNHSGGHRLAHLQRLVDDGARTRGGASIRGIETAWRRWRGISFWSLLYQVRPRKFTRERLSFVFHLVICTEIDYIMYASGPRLEELRLSVSQFPAEFVSTTSCASAPDAQRVWLACLSASFEVPMAPEGHGGKAYTSNLDTPARRESLTCTGANLPTAEPIHPLPVAFEIANGKNTNAVTSPIAPVHPSAITEGSIGSRCAGC